jgi:hypothetical protein
VAAGLVALAMAARVVAIRVTLPTGAGRPGALSEAGRSLQRALPTNAVADDTPSWPKDMTTPMDESLATSECGICRLPMNGVHGDDHGGRSSAGKRVEYLVVGKRGGIAEFREAGIDSKVRKTDAAMLAFQLGVEPASLPECRFTCWVEPAEYGVVRSEFTLVDD